MLVALPPAPVPAAPNIARVLSATRALAQPGSGRLVMALGVRTPLSSGPQQLRITATRTRGGQRYYRVLLPMRPNGATGWVSAAKVQAIHTAFHVTVDRAHRTIVVRRHGAVVKRARVVVGKPASPTPEGEFAISEVVRQADPRAFVGPWVLALTAFSGTYRQFDGGPGRVAIHGRDGASLRDPLGTARSHGCIRVDNRLVRWMAGHLQPGVAVTIRR